VTKKRLSEIFREQLDSLGKSLASHTRSLDDHFEHQKEFLESREEEIVQSQKQLHASNTPNKDPISIILTPYLKGDLNLLTVAELKKLCSVNKLKKYSQLLKKDLIQLLRNNQIQAPLLPPKKLVKKMKKTDLEKIVQIFLEDELQSS
jgi:hypothetical protein